MRVEAQDSLRWVMLWAVAAIQSLRLWAAPQVAEGFPGAERPHPNHVRVELRAFTRDGLLIRGGDQDPARLAAGPQPGQVLGVAHVCSFAAPE